MQASNIVPFVQHNKTPKFKYLAVNNANEHLMPVRLYYEVEARRIVGHLYALGCVKRVNNYYVLFSSKDANHNSAAPIMIGRIMVNYQQNSMIIDLDSYNRAIFVITMLEKHASKQAKNLQFVATYNRFIFTTEEGFGFEYVDFDNYNNIFTEEKTDFTLNLTDLFYDDPTTLMYEYPVIEKFEFNLAVQSMRVLVYEFQLRFGLAELLQNGVNYSMQEFYKRMEQKNKPQDFFVQTQY